MAFNPGKIQTKVGKWSETCVTDSDLVANQAKFPVIRNLLEYVDQRQISTLLVSGAVGPYGVGHVSTKVSDVLAKGKEIGNHAYRFDVMGRIQQSSVINENGQVGSTTTNGTFKLSMKDNYLTPGMNVLFYGSQFQARVMSAPTGSAGNYVYTFQSPDGAVFVWATHVGAQSGEKTCFGGYSSFGEKSLRGYGRSHFPDQFVQHMTTQRKTVGISGGAGSDVLWLEYDGPKGKFRGWMFEELRQAQAQWMIEDEFQKWFGISSMKNTDGTLRASSRLVDLETGNNIVQGDGIVQQIAGGNEVAASGVTGNATANDFIDMMNTLKVKGSKVKGITWVAVTGSQGISNARTELISIANTHNEQFQQNVTQTTKAGGAQVYVGFDYVGLNIDGNQVVFVEHPMFDDAAKFPELGTDGKSIQSGTYYFISLETVNGMNMEMLHKGANGISRGKVERYLHGLTGDPASTIVTEEDALKYAMLKEDMIVMYNTTICGIINKQ
jgi:hypothetical protein